ncbi:exopolysaccharide biosynthesis protein [Lysobacter sp. HDW10]|uniref:exopolysaccharide biosynthesis protein n=1 Tax=Lysobacter sp. HDW10 TaxID=2714936 RepID=UPI00140A08D2|nr:exopolysaccharide biosynthesis protein [Lysobacter sp. HDW10]QIK81342.1 exopolysaccharide biosynthesis protein [Lysobacter sp. HDW10]
MQSDKDTGLLGMVGRLAQGDPESHITMHQIIDEVEESGFGMILFVLTLPAFIPIPVGGALSGPLVALLALQMIVGRHEPWLPKRLLSKGPKRSALAKVHAQLSRIFRPVHRLIRPRADWIFENSITFRFTGLILLFLAVLLALPIPGTNYLFGLTLVLFALAMIERDGGLMIVSWCVGLALIIAAFVLSGQIIDAFNAIKDNASDVLHRIFV